MDPKKLFGAVPEDLAAISDEDIQGLLAAHLEAIDKIAGDDKEFLGELDGAEIVSQMEAGVEDVERIKAELSAREEAAATFQARVDELAAKAKPEVLAAEGEEGDEGDAGDESGDESGDDADSEGEGGDAEASGEVAVDAEDALETVVAAAPRMRRPLPRPSAQHQPLETQPVGFTASSGVPGFTPGQHLKDKVEVARAIMAARRTMESTPPGFRQNVVVASIDTAKNWPEDRKLAGKGEDPDGARNWAKIEDVTSPQVIRAAGGICAPATPYYEQQLIAVQDRPVRDALAGFAADRGGIIFNPPIGIGTITGSDAIGLITAAEDGEGGTFATKTCLTVECVDSVEVDVDIIFHCVTWSNLTGRTFPERVAQVNDTVMAGWARLAEINLLNGIRAASTVVVQANATNQGATSTLLGSMLTAAAGLRSRQRMAADASLRAILPAWSRDLLVADIVRSQFQRFDMTEAGLLALLRSYNINASFYLDGPSAGVGQIFGPQNGGGSALEPFPTVVQWALFPEGSFLYLDGGRLELGIVRDSVLNSTNQYQIFGEGFENVAFVGIESLWVETTVCPSGVVAAPATNTAFCS